MVSANALQKDLLPQKSTSNKLLEKFERLVQISRAVEEVQLKYEARILEVANTILVPLAFACSGGTGPCATRVMTRIIRIISPQN